MKTVVFDVGKEVNSNTGEVTLFITNIELGPVVKGKNEKDAFERFEAALLTALRIQYQRRHNISNPDRLDDLIFAENTIVLHYEGTEHKLQIPA